MTIKFTEVVIVGSGMVGAALALGLAQHGVEVTVIESILPVNLDLKKTPDIRVSAINIASIRLFYKLGILDLILNIRSHPFSQLEAWISDKMHIAFHAKDLNFPLLGYIVENNVIKSTLWQYLKEKEEVTFRAPAFLKSICKFGNHQIVTLNNGEQFIAKLVVGADGANSQVRQMLGIGIYAWKYQQNCMVITVQCEQEPGESSWQYFTQNGVHAFLPLFKNWASLVWYDTPKRIHQLKAMTLIQLQNEIQKHFPSRLGKVRPIEKITFPLFRYHAKKYIQEGAVLVGDAAHTVHPLAGQGVNLGYRDVVVLLNILINSRKNGEAWKSETVLKRYQRKRMIDNYLMQFGIDMCYFILNNTHISMKVLKKIAFFSVENIKILKHHILKYATLGFYSE